MTDWKLKLYHHLPPILQDVAASYRGLELRNWRYGPETEQLVAETLERDRWTPEQWKSYQENRLSRILHRAATSVPYYRDQWSERRRKGDRSSWEHLENWAILEKDPLRKNPAAFVADDCDTRRMYSLRTSGTSGTPLQLWWSREAARQWYAIFEARNRRWNGVSWREKWAIMGGQMVVPFSRDKPPFWVRNYPMNQTYLSTHHVSARTLDAYAEAITDARFTHVVAYTSSIAFLAKLAHESARSLAGTIRIIITNAEPLFEWQRDSIQEAFQCRVIETYGQAEAVAAASEDPDGILRYWPESGLLEVLDGNNLQVNSGETGSFIATHLFNEDMPLVRYRVGDRGAWSATLNPTHHNHLPALERVEGRNTDMILAKDGRQVFWLNPVFYGLPIVEAQIRQDGLDEIRVLCVPSSGFDASTIDTIRARLLQRIGDLDIQVEETDHIPREKSGKFRAVISNLY